MKRTMPFKNSYRDKSTLLKSRKLLGSELVNQILTETLRYIYLSIANTVQNNYLVTSFRLAEGYWRNEVISEESDLTKATKQQVATH